MKVKVCGLKYADNINAVAKLGPDYMGFIFYDKTPRFVETLAVDAVRSLPENTIKTAVFVNETLADVNAIVDKYDFDAVQLHGSENAEFCAALKGKVTVIKAFGLNKKFDFETLDHYKDNVDYFLFDAKTPIHGGSGTSFDWNLLNKYKLNVPFFLSGGISPDNLEEIKKITHPMFYGVDLNSRFETGPGVKDINKLEKAFEMLKTVDTNEIRS
jgi:phosphoribosylanthranilate isomerase